MENAATRPIMLSQRDAVPYPCINSHGLSEEASLGNSITPPKPINKTITIESDSDVSLPTLSSLLSRAKKCVPEANHDDGVGQSIQSNMNNVMPLRLRPAQKRSYALVQDDEIGYEVPASTPTKRKGQTKSKGQTRSKGVKEDKVVQTETCDTFISQDTSRLSERQASMMIIVEELFSNAAYGITYLEDGIRVVQNKQKELREQFSKLAQEG